MSETPVSPTRSASGSHAGRISVIATHTFTQLVRMKVFYFLAVFAVITIGSNFFDLPQHAGPEAAGTNILNSIKSWSVGTMTLFSVVFAIVATALLLPKDVEDRTLYTILAKPVPRIDYLAGKLLGVILLVFVSLALMDLLMTAVLQIRTSIILSGQLELAHSRGWSAAETASLRADILSQGPNASLQGAVFVVFLRASIMASLALFISTFSSSTLFTSIISFLIYFIGHFQDDARRVFLEAGAGWVTRAIALLVALVLPDFHLFNEFDAVIQGQVFPLLLLGKLTGIGMFYAVFYVLASWYIFAEKEF